MKVNLSSIAVVIILASVGWIMYFGSRPPKGTILVSQSYFDSVKNLTPDTVTLTDTIKPPPDTVKIVKRVPVPVEAGENRFAYHDSLVNKFFAIHVFDTISNKGIVLGREWKWRLFVPEKIIETITIEKPIPVPYEVPCPEIRKDLRYYGEVGFGTTFTLGGGVLVRDRFLCGANVGKDLAIVKVGYVF